MTQFTASEVRDYLFSIEERSSRQWLIAHDTELGMLRQFADLLEAREKAVPIYQHRSRNGSMLRWFDCSEETFMAMEHSEHDREHFDRRILYTHPSPADAKRLADRRDDAFQQAVREARRVWMDEFPCDAGHDHVTPFDQFLYGNKPCVEAQPPAQPKYAPPYPDQAQDPFWKVPGMVDTRPKAQPPAAVEQSDWPEELMLRDTGIHDDQGGLGQRIFTTAGAGYKKVKYVRADLLQVGQCEPHTPAASVTDAMVGRALYARVPGGAQVWHWLPDEYGKHPHPTAYTIMRAALEAALAAQENRNG